MKVSMNKVGEFAGKEIIEYTMENNTGIRISALNIGCAITELLTPDKQGNLENIVIGLDDPYDYLKNPQYFGAIIGRVAGRIKGSSFELDDVTYRLPANEGQNHIHGGIHGFHTKIWEGTMIEKGDAVGVVFKYLSKAGEEGYPGDLSLSVTYLLNERGEWTQEIRGVTNEKTLINLTNHSYFNLSGDFKSGIEAHLLEIQSDHFLKLAEDFIPTGEMEEVEGTVFDLKAGREIREAIQSDDPQTILVGNGFDHPFLLDREKNNSIMLRERRSGRKLVVDTNQPCVVVYTGNNIANGTRMKGGNQTYKHCALCLETQGLPDAIHHQHFPSIVLEPGETYYSYTKYKFDVEN